MLKLLTIELTLLIKRAQAPEATHIRKTVKSLSNELLGVISPQPIEVIVVIAQQSELTYYSVIEESCKPFEETQLSELE